MSSRVFKLSLVGGLLAIVGLLVLRHVDEAALLSAVRRGDTLAVRRWLTAHRRDRMNTGRVTLLRAAVFQTLDNDDAGMRVLKDPTAEAILTAFAEHRPVHRRVQEALLHSALANGFYPLASRILRDGADPNAGSPHPPLFQAVERLDANAVKLLLEAGADPNAKASFDTLWGIGSLPQSRVLTPMDYLRFAPRNGGPDHQGVIREAEVRNIRTIRQLLIVHGARPVATTAPADQSGRSTAGSVPARGG